MRTCERRQKTRIKDPIACRLRGEDVHGRIFVMEAQLDNLSASGFYVRLGCRPECGAPLLASFFLPAEPGNSSLGTRWSTRGVIRRVEPKADGTCGLGVEFTSHDEIYI